MSTRRAKTPLLHETLPVGSLQRAQMRSLLSPRISHGGQLTIGKRKTARPFTPRGPVHIVLKSSRAKGQWSLLHRKHKSKILSMIYVYADRYKVHVYRASNVGDHIHLLVRAQEKKQLQDYLRVLAGRIAVTVTGAKRGVKRLSPQKVPGATKTGTRKFWRHLCWSRLVAWGRDFYVVSNYVLANELEGIGKEFEPDSPRGKKPLSKQYRDFILRTREWMNET